MKKRKRERIIAVNMYLRHNSNNVVRSNGVFFLSLSWRALKPIHKTLWVCNANKMHWTSHLFWRSQNSQTSCKYCVNFLHCRMKHILNYRIVVNVWGQWWVKASIFTKILSYRKSSRRHHRIYWTGNHRFHDSSCKRAEKWYKREKKI